MPQHVILSPRTSFGAKKKDQNDRLRRQGSLGMNSALGWRIQLQCSPLRHGYTICPPTSAACGALRRCNIWRALHQTLCGTPYLRCRVGKGAQ